jgi:hypothetical protein
LNRDTVPPLPDEVKRWTHAVCVSSVPAYEPLTVREVDIFVSSSSGLPDDNPALTPPGKLTPAACSVIKSEDLAANPDPDRALVRHLRTKREDPDVPDAPNIEVTVAETSDDAIWPLTASAPLRAAVRDIVLVLGYIAAEAEEA